MGYDPKVNGGQVMSRWMGAVAVGILLMAGPAAAQDEPLVVIQVEPAQDDGRLALAREFARLATVGMDKIVSQSLQAAVGEPDSPMDDEQSRWFVANGATIMSRHLPTLIDAMAVDYADRFTVAELEAIIAFYDTPMGRDIARKQLEAGAAMGPAVAQFQMAFVADLMEKYCASFDCTAEGATAMKNRR